MQQINTRLSRGQYDAARQALIARNLNPDKAVLTSSFLRSEAQFATTSLTTPTSTNYTFGFQINQVSTNSSGAPFNTERRLALQDGFMITEIGVFIGKPSSATDVNWRKYAYGNPAVFSSANVATSMNGLFEHGFLSLAIDNAVVLPAWDLSRHFSVGITQQSTWATTPTTGSLVSPVDQFDGTTTGYYPVGSNIWFTGGQNINLQINAAAAITACEAYSRIIVITRGILAQNILAGK